MAVPYQRTHVITNPAAGQDQPILNTLKDVFNQFKVDWEVSVTRKLGDATQMAKAAVASGVVRLAKNWASRMKKGRPPK